MYLPASPVILAVLAVALHYAIDYAGCQEFTVHKQGGVLVTGASTGIGRDAAIGLARKGFVVFAGVRKQQDAESLLKENIPLLKPVMIDVTKQDTVDSCYDAITKELASSSLPFVALINNAGIAKTYPIEFMKMDDVKWNFEVNYYGLIRVTQKFLSLLRKTGNGARIVQISSVAGKVAASGGNPYSSTKWAVESLSESLRRELHPFGISVSCINPGFIKTPILDTYKQLREAAPEAHVALYPHVLGEAVFETEERLMKAAPTTEVTTAAIVHAVADPYPQLHYVLGHADGFPMWSFTFLSWLLPGRLFDVVLRNV